MAGKISKIFNQQKLQHLNLKKENIRNRIYQCLMLGRFFWNLMDHKQSVNMKQKLPSTCK